MDRAIEFHSPLRALPLNLKKKVPGCEVFVMTTPDFQDLTEEERILHHHAAIIKKDLEIYHACSRTQQDWNKLFINHLRKSMNFYADICKRNPDLTIRIHPLLLSLTETINASQKNPDLSTISEYDERVLRSDLYTSLRAFPQLETHFSGQNSPSLLSNQMVCSHIGSVAGCRECIAPVPQGNAGGEAREGNVTQDNSAASLQAEKDNLEHMGSAPLSTRRKGKRPRRASSSSVQSDQGSPSNTRCPVATGVVRRAKGKQARTLDANPSPQGEMSHKSSREGRDREVEPRTVDGITLAEDLKNEVQALKNGRNMLEKTIKDLRSICDTHLRTLENFGSTL